MSALFGGMIKMLGVIFAVLVLGFTGFQTWRRRIQTASTKRFGSARPVSVRPRPNRPPCGNPAGKLPPPAGLERQQKTPAVTPGPEPKWDFFLLREIIAQFPGFGG